MESPVAPAAGPCVYVPISHPDSSVPTYAVLQVLGISSAPDPPLLPQYPPLSSAPKPCPSSAESGHSSSSSSSGERDRRLTSLRPAPMKKSGSGSCLAPSALSPAVRRPTKLTPSFKPIISITHTDKDTVIQAAPSDFRKVVHQLTGAASGEKGLMPITSVARPAPPSNRAGAEFASTAQVSASQCLGTDSGGGGGGGGGGSGSGSGSGDIRSASGGKSVGDATANLLQRRKSSKVLGRLSTSCRNLPPLMPSPVTPLASDFEKIGLPATPSSSEGSLTPGIGSVASLSPLSHGTKAMQTLSLSGGGAGGSHTHHGSAPTSSRSHRDASMQVKLCSIDAMDMQAPEISELLQPQSLGFHSNEDVKLASPLRSQNRKISSRLVVRDADLLSLGLAPATGAMSLPNAADVRNEEELGAHEDVDTMDIETPGNGAGGVHDLSSTVRESCSAEEEDSIISKKGFFFHSERPQHRDARLLALFPESSRES